MPGRNTCNPLQMSSSLLDQSALRQIAERLVAAARSAGQIGEQPDGYLGFVTTPTPEVRALVQDLNIKRKATYTERAKATGSTVEQYAFTTGCNLIAKTAPGEKYQSPDGRWLTRDASAPVRDSRCP